MPSVDSTVSANYLKAKSNFSQFGTRALTFINVDVANIETNPSDANSIFSRAIRAMQQVAEIYYVGIPSSAGVTFIVSSDTYVNSTDNNSQTIEEAFAAAGLTTTAVNIYTNITGVTLTA
mgnify:CR=1 FL=1